MYPLIKQYLSSDQGREAFCEAVGLTVSTLSYWVSKYKRDFSEPSASAFIPIHLSDSGLGAGPVMELTLSGGRIRFYSYPDPSYVQALLGLDVKFKQ
jgi:hypothetical protein